MWTRDETLVLRSLGRATGFPSIHSTTRGLSLAAISCCGACGQRARSHVDDALPGHRWAEDNELA